MEPLEVVNERQHGAAGGAAQAKLAARSVRLLQKRFLAVLEALGAKLQDACGRCVIALSNVYLNTGSNLAKLVLLPVIRPLSKLHNLLFQFNGVLFERRDLDARSREFSKKMRLGVKELDFKARALFRAARRSNALD